MNNNEYNALINQMDNNAIQRLLREIDSMDLAVALKNEDKSVKTKFLSNMSERAAELIEEHIGLMTDVTDEEVEKAKEKILAILNELLYEHDEGKYDGEI